MQFIEDRTDVLNNSEELVKRFGIVIREAFRQLGESIGNDKLLEMRQLALDAIGVKSADYLSELLSQDTSWWWLPDVSEELAMLFDALYKANAQLLVDLVWVDLFSRELVASSLAPGIVAIPDTVVFRQEAQEVMNRLDAGTRFHLVRLLLQETFDPVELRSQLFLSGETSETILNYRIKKVVDTETKWLHNRCLYDILTHLKVNKQWLPSDEACEIAIDAAAEGSVACGYLYGHMRGYHILHPPGCTDCGCRLSIGDTEKVDIVIKANVGSAVIILKVPDEFKSLLGVKQPHITVCYLGSNVVGEEFQRAIAATAEAMLGRLPFSIFLTGEVERLGPPGQEVSVARVYPSSSLISLQQDIVAGLSSVGVPVDKTYGEYHPHLTLGTADSVSQDSITDFGNVWRVDGVNLWWNGQDVYLPFQNGSITN